MKNLKKISAIFGLLLFFVFTGQQTALAYNFVGDSGLDTTATGAGYKTSNVQTPEYFIGQIIQMVLSFLGILFLGFMIYAGFTWMTATGNEQKAEKAKEILIESIIGLIIVIAAYTITYFIYSYFGTVN
jgi:hypothetical protein